MRIERLPVTLLDAARADLFAGAPSLREFAWGIIAYKEGKTPQDVELRRAKFRHGRPPWGVYLEARLCLRTHYRGQKTPLLLPEIEAACAQLSDWRPDALYVRSIRAL